jgi:release factor glutamine methyltransferase
LTAGRETLVRAGIAPSEASLDARLLAQHLLGWTTAALLTSGNTEEPPGFSGRFLAFVERRARREPLAYITGVREFWNLRFEVSPAVLIPRPETETLVAALLERVPTPGGGVRVADVCTGSGCVAVSIATERPHIMITATDISELALEVAARNATRHGVRERIDFVCADLLAGVPGRFTAIVANPPYVRDVDRNGLQAEVRDYEPDIALFGGADGLAMIRALIDQAAAHLAGDGILFFEFGHGQEDGVRELISASRELRMIDVKPDLQGIARVAVAGRRG